MGDGGQKGPTICVRTSYTPPYPYAILPPPYHFYTLFQWLPSKNSDYYLKFSSIECTIVGMCLRVAFNIMSQKTQC